VTVQWLWASPPVMPLLTAIVAKTGTQPLLLLHCLHARWLEVANRRSCGSSRVRPCLLMCNKRPVLLCSASCWRLWWLRECPRQAIELQQCTAVRV
jgi:hypothetical protein